MKDYFLLFIVCFSFVSAHCQSLPNFSTIKLDFKKDFDSSSNEAALQAANFILNVPIQIVGDSGQRLKATQYMLKWMSGTPEFNFNVDNSVEKVAKENDELVRIFLAAMVKFGLENKQAAKDLNLLKLQSFKIVLVYCKNTKNNVSVSGELKKMMVADDNGKLAAFLKL